MKNNFYPLAILLTEEIFYKFLSPEKFFEFLGTKIAIFVDSRIFF